MKKLLLSMLCALGIFALSAQISDDFSDYTVGEKIAQQAHAMGREHWTTWDIIPGGGMDGIIVEMPAGNKCLRAVVHSSTLFDDNVLRLGDKVGTTWTPKSTGVWELAFKIYIPTGKDGYFNIKSVFPSTTPNTWAMQIYMGVEDQTYVPTPGQGFIYGGSNNKVRFNFTHDTWVPINIKIDLDADWAEFKVNDNLVHSYQYTLGSFGENGQPPYLPTPKSIAGLNIFPSNTNGSTSLFYVDDIVFKEWEAPPPQPLS